MPCLGVFLSALALVPQSSGLQTKVQYSNPGAQAKTILSDLSKATGIGLEAAPQTIHEVLAVRLNNIPLEEAMTRIAWAVDGGWKQVGDTYRLVRTPGQQREEERLLLENTAKKFKAMLDARQATLAAAPQFSPADAAKLAADLQAVLRTFNPQNRQTSVWQRSRALDRKGPPGRALDRLSLLFDPYELAAMAPRMNAVYSSDPTPTQRPLGEKGMAVVKQYIQEQSVWAAEATRRQIHNPQSGTTTYIMGGLSGNTEPVSDRIGKVLFIVSKWDIDQPPQLQLWIGDTKGKIITECNGTLGDSFGPSAVSPAKTVPVSAIKMKVPPSVLAFQKAWDYRNPSSTANDIREKISQPEKFEPLGLGTGALLVAVAETQKLSMVVDLSDDLVTAAGNAPEIVPETYLSGLTSYFLDREEVSGWLLMRPKWPSRTRSMQVDRAALGKYLRKLAANGRVTLDERADYICHCPEDARNTIQQIAEAMLVGPKNEFYDENLLRLYGSMSSEQRLGAQKAGISYGSLTPYQVHIVQKMLYGPNSRLQFEPQDARAQDLQTKYELYGNGILREVTEALPSGPPAASRLKLSSTESEVAMCERSGRNGLRFAPQNMATADYAFRKFAQEKPELFPWMQDQQDTMDLNRVQFGTQTTVEFRFQFTPELSLQSTIRSSDMKANEYVAYTSLPESFRKEVEARVAELRKMYANQRPEGGNGIAVPPPP